MNKRILLWLNVFFACGHFTGHLFDTLVIVPNWKEGSVEVITNFRAFFTNADPGAYFAIFVMAPTLFAILSFLFYYKTHRDIKITLGLGLAITLISTASTFLYFFPINNYLFWGQDVILEPAKTKELVENWVFAERIRLIIGLAALLAAARALHLSYVKVNT
ncbi:MAG: DUF1772 domain-containing protein [Saprospiraceae bacterium]